MTLTAPAPVVVARTRVRWEWPALAALLAATAALYIWGLSASGWANSFYSAAAQAGSATLLRFVLMRAWIFRRP